MTAFTASEPRTDRYDAVIVGGGFYGCAIGCHLARHGYSVCLLEREDRLMGRASFANQARLHNGYHYPRSYRTAKRSRVNLPLFMDVFPEAVYDDYRPLYAIARHGSKVSPAHFERFCRLIGMPIKPATAEDKAMFDSRLIEQVYEVFEPTFNAEALRRHQEAELERLDIDVVMRQSVCRVAPSANDNSVLEVETESGQRLGAGWVFNCTYANLRHVAGPATDRTGDGFGLVHQIAEIALFQPPPALAERGVTVMDGPFFSTIPFPARGMHSLTHVRYTHHAKWEEDEASDAAARNRLPTDILDEYLARGGGAMQRSRFAWMVRDAARYMPVLTGLECAEAVFDVKTLAVGTAADDARPILMHRDASMPRFISVMGGKVDNIFDILEFIDENLGLTPSALETSQSAAAGA